MGMSDTMLKGGCAPHINAVHSEWITVTSGLDAGKKFLAVVEVDADAMLAESMAVSKGDRRARKQMRFMEDNPVPSLPPQTTVKTEDGKTWHVVDDPQNGYLSTDFQILEKLDRDK